MLPILLFNEIIKTLCKQYNVSFKKKKEDSAREQLMGLSI